jgi:hypothetical protein
MLFLPFTDKRKPGNPLIITQKYFHTTRFGERADFSPDNKSVA